MTLWQKKTQQTYGNNNNINKETRWGDKKKKKFFEKSIEEMKPEKTPGRV